VANSPVIGVRIDGTLKDRFDAFRARERVTSSQAIRLLLELGLSRGDKLDEAWTQATLREGRIEGSREIHSVVAQTLKENSK